MEDFGIWEKLFFSTLHFLLLSARASLIERKHSHFTRTRAAQWTFTFQLALMVHMGTQWAVLAAQNASLGKIETTSQWEWWWWWWFICPFFRSFIKMNTLSSISDDLHLLLQLPLLVEPIALDMRSWMNRGWTQFGDAVLLSRMEPLEAESISQRRRSRCHELSRFGYSDYRWIIGENGCLLQDLNQDELV